MLFFDWSIPVKVLFHQSPSKFFDGLWSKFSLTVYTIKVRFNNFVKVFLYKICLFRTAIHIPWTEKKKTLIPYIYNASNKVKDPF